MLLKNSDCRSVLLFGDWAAQNSLQYASACGANSSVTKAAKSDGRTNPYPHKVAADPLVERFLDPDQVAGVTGIGTDVNLAFLFTAPARAADPQPGARPAPELD